ncbi:PDZ domain-containing protein [Bacillus carboniphilus]|uniref:PDZ domain-containing protein n=1 Tax=Bacillus carboniphilus TaxID=86663 RepID=A0ABY9JSS7_9BACI|nr:PDZ domain-containing protein [Bacillus carboniphilus]WLR41475.1 PDZ domain-containing protein [Bacillus carboniphilus]
MLEQWLMELSKGIGRFFLNPLLYFMLFYCVIIGVLRVKRERKSFHIRIYDTLEEVKFTFLKGLFLGVLFSLVILLTGLMLPFGTIVLMTVWTLLLCITLQTRLLSPVYTMGGTILLVSILSMIDLKEYWFSQYLINVETTSLPTLAILLALLIIIEGFLVYRSGHLKTSPSIKMSSRGKSIGNHRSDKVWMAADSFVNSRRKPINYRLVSFYVTWRFLLAFVCSVICRISPKNSRFNAEGKYSSNRSKNHLARVINAYLCDCESLVDSSCLWSVGFSFVGHQFISIKQRMNDDSAAFYFSKRDQGLVILGILPSSPANQLNLQVGEMIIQVNGQPVTTVSGFYEALQKNRTYCKLDVIGFNGEVRFVQRSMYEGEHHELGLIFIGDDKKTEAEQCKHKK